MYWKKIKIVMKTPKYAIKETKYKLKIFNI